MEAPGRPSSLPDIASLRIRREARPVRARRRWPWVLLVLLLALGGAVWVARDRIPGLETRVEVGMVVRLGSSGGDSSLLNANGYVVARTKASVSSKVLGRLAWIGVTEGSHVRTGEVIARLESADYGWMASSIAEVVSPSRILVFLEGGYHLPAITESVAATVRGLMGKPPEPLGGFRSPAAAFVAVDVAVEHAGRRWSVA